LSGTTSNVRRSDSTLIGRVGGKKMPANSKRARVTGRGGFFASRPAIRAQSDSGGGRVRSWPALGIRKSPKHWRSGRYGLGEDAGGGRRRSGRLGAEAIVVSPAGRDGHGRYYTNSAGGPAEEAGTEALVQAKGDDARQIEFGHVGGWGSDREKRRVSGRLGCGIEVRRSLIGALGRPRPVSATRPSGSTFGVLRRARRRVANYCELGENSGSRPPPYYT